MPRTAKDLAGRAKWIAAISEGTRLQLLLVLATGPQTVTRLAALCQVEIANVSPHMMLLNRVGLVSGVKNGRMMIYSLVGARVTAGMLELAHPSGVKVTLPLA